MSGTVMVAGPDEATLSCTLEDSMKQAYLNHQLPKCIQMLNNAVINATEERERRRLYANLVLCVYKSKAELFHANYQSALLKTYPELHNLESHQLENSDEAAAAYNLALNAFIRGNQRTALQFINAIFSMRVVPEKIFFVVSLLEIELSLALCQPKLALKQAIKLRDSPLWRRASCMQHDYLECLECRIRYRLAQMSPVVDFSQKPQDLHWILLQSELDVKNGNGSRALSRLMKCRPTLQDEERRLVDNATGCVYALSMKKTVLAESYFRSAMLPHPTRRKSWQESTIPRHCLIYHAALAQLQSGQAEQAFELFLAVLHFYPRQPRIWLRLAECCICVQTKEDGGMSEISRCLKGVALIHLLQDDERKKKRDILQDFKDFLDEYYEKGEDSKCSESVRKPSCPEDNQISRISGESDQISWEYAARCANIALILTGSDRDCVYLLPWIYGALAFINLNLCRYTLALRAACHLASLPQVSPHHKLMAVLYKTEALVFLDRLSDAVECIKQAVPLQSMPSTTSAVVYNRALLLALSGNLHRSRAVLNLLGVQHKDSALFPDAVTLGAYLNSKIENGEEIRSSNDEEALKATE